MLRYLKLSILIMFLLSLMSCPAPTTVSGRIPGLPGNISDIINTGSSNFWFGRENGASDFINLSNENSTWKIRISNPSNGQNRFCEYVSESGINGNVGSDNKWSAKFRLKKCENDGKEKQEDNQHQEVLELTMQFTSTREAQATLRKVNEVSGSKCSRYKDYGPFKMVSA